MRSLEALLLAGPEIRVLALADLVDDCVEIDSLGDIRNVAPPSPPKFLEQKVLFLFWHIRVDLAGEDGQNERHHRKGNHCRVSVNMLNRIRLLRSRLLSAEFFVKLDENRLGTAVLGRRGVEEHEGVEGFKRCWRHPSDLPVAEQRLGGVSLVLPQV
eukprot:m.7015 g.7015  ORF g.7015 m.7015 type:complete len:157 (-) comp3903_c0_seq1:1466-1936(-)